MKVYIFHRDLTGQGPSKIEHPGTIGMECPSHGSGPILNIWVRNIPTLEAWHKAIGNALTEARAKGIVDGTIVSHEARQAAE